MLLGASVAPAALVAVWPLALLPLAYVAAITAVSQGEVHGGRTRTGWLAVGLLGAVLLALTAPVLGLRLGTPDDGNRPADDTRRQAYDLIAEGFGPGLNGPLLRAQTGDLLKVSVANDLPEDTSVHWHGLALRNDADGVQGVTQDPIAAGGRYTYGFRLSHPGTYWYHSHFDTQRERALYGALIVEGYGAGIGDT